MLDTYLQLQQYEEGLAYFEQFAPRHNPPATLLSRHAVLLTLAGKSHQAVQQFRLAMSLAISVSDLSVRQVSADVYNAFAQLDATILFTTNPPSGSLGQANDRILVRLYRAANRFDEAITTLKQLIEATTEAIPRADLLAELGDVCQAGGYIERAHSAYVEALKYHDDRWITLNNLAYLLSDKLGEHSKARAYAERAVQLSDNPDALDTLGWIYVGLQDYPKAIAELSRAIRLNPDQPLTYYHLGEAYRRQGRFDQAGEILRNGRKLAQSQDGQQRHDLILQFTHALEKVTQSINGP